MDHDPSHAAPRITAIATATPACDVHATYSDWARVRVDDPRKRALLKRMLARSGIDHRYSALGSADGAMGFGSFYNNGDAPGTAERMARYARAAPALALEAISHLPALGAITHMVTASCTGFLAPGLDQVVARQLRLDPGIQRLFLGFMGCYAGVTALRAAADIVRADPQARVLVLSTELCTLHLQETNDLEALLAMGQFADGAAAAIVTGSGEGMGLGQAFSLTLPEAGELITWTIGDTGFAMQLSGAVPGRIAEALAEPEVVEAIAPAAERASITGWAVHPGGRSVLDAVERGLNLPADRLQASRSVLRDCGNMSSASVLFVLERLMPERHAKGLALAFGPGLAMEGLHCGWVT